MKSSLHHYKCVTTNKAKGNVLKCFLRMLFLHSFIQLVPRTPIETTAVPVLALPLWYPSLSRTYGPCFLLVHFFPLEHLPHSVSYSCFVLSFVPHCIICRTRHNSLHAWYLFIGLCLCVGLNGFTECLLHSSLDLTYL